jgi:uncharacterized protein (TIGR02646 family)
MGARRLKRVNPGHEPSELQIYREKRPQSTWEEMKADRDAGGSTAYEVCRQQLINSQGGICAYCEIDIRDNNPLKCRVEHFHPKSDSQTYNWALNWQNLLGVCAGGSSKYLKEAEHYSPPLPANLSCDAYKDHQITKKKLPEQCEGWILNPMQIPAFPSLFQIEKSTGKLHPSSAAELADLALPDNQHDDLVSLVQHTIDMLNLNCDRLSQARLRIIRDIERRKKQERLAGYNAQQGLSNIAKYYMRQQWPGFITTIRLCLGKAVEDHLKKSVEN